MTNSIFGTIIPGSLIEQAVLSVIQTYMKRYLTELERQLGYPTGSFVIPDNYTTRNEYNMEAGERLPKVVVISPGLAKQPEKYNAKQYRATWNIGVGIALVAKTEDEANELVKIYAAAVRAILLKKGAVPLATEVTWINEDYSLPAINFQNQKLKTAGTYFTVDVEDVVSRWVGPDSPDDPSYEWGTAETVNVTLTKEANDD